MISLNLYYTMLKTVRKIGNSQGIIFDAEVMNLANLKVGDQLKMEIDQSRTITLTPIRPRPCPREISKTIKATMKDYARTMKKLA